MPRKKDGIPEHEPVTSGGVSAKAQPGRKVPPEEIPQIVASKEPASYWAAHYGCSEALIYRYRREAGGGGRRRKLLSEERLNDPARGQTLETIYARCEEKGACRVWQGPVQGGRNPTPALFHAGKMHVVRNVVAHLAGLTEGDGHGVWGTRCKTPGCVAEGHLKFRNRGEHLKLRNKSLPAVFLHLRNLKVAQAKERKIPLEDIPLIKSSTEPTKVLAERYQCSEGLIRRYRGKTHVVNAGNPWAALLRGS